MQVLLADQQKINRFSRLNLRMKELDGEIDMMKVTNCMYASNDFL